MVTWSGWKSFLEKSIDEVPQNKGVYELGTSSEVYYIGQSEDLRRRLKEHLTGNDSCIQKSTIFRYFETSYPNTDEENQLKSYKSEHGRLPRCNDKPS